MRMRRRRPEPAPVIVTAPASPALPRGLAILVCLAAAWLVVTGLQQMKEIVGPLLLTLNLVIVAYPIQAWLNRRGAPRVLGALATGVVVFAVLVAFFGSLAWALTKLVEEIPGYQGRFLTLYQQMVGLLAQAGVTESQLVDELAKISPSNAIGVLQRALSGVGGALSLLVVTVTIIFVVLIDSMTVSARMSAGERSQPRFVDSLVDFAGGVRRYWVVSTIFGLIVAAIDIAALLFLGVPLALVWGLLAWLTNYIPNIGFVLGVVPPALMALLANGPQTALIVVIAYSVINFVIQSVIQPKFNGDAVGVNATVSLLSLLFWAWVLGPLGALLALPATLLCKAVLVDADPGLRWLNAFIASDPDSADPETQPGTKARGAVAARRV